MSRRGTARFPICRSLGDEMTFIKRFFVMAVAAVFLVGCQTTGSGSYLGASDEPDMSPAERTMHERSEAFNRTIWEGAAMGAVGGAIMGILIGRDAKSAAIGAAAGALAGGLAGNYLANKQQQYAHKEQQLDAMIADVHTKNVQAKQMVSALEDVVAEDRKRLALANKQYEDGLIKKAEYDREIKDVKDNRAYIDSQIADARKQHKVFKDAGNEFQKANPGTDMKKYDSEVEELGRRIDYMAKVSDEISDPSLG
ncbi:glycine zipper domain-containing protein [Parvibaculum sp.]|uniref:YMGG-like glycine zipper-containing protein n=1 Tax=Parvibaculum sp. TaxID=2024848 RepID=UPI0025CD54F8|nr:glycine zipper domain-containing protein [Parvibaculum sp.]